MLPARVPYPDDGGYGGGYPPTRPSGGQQPYGFPDQTGRPSFAESRGGRETDKRTSSSSRRPPPSWQAPNQPRPKYEADDAGYQEHEAYMAACAAAHDGIQGAMKKAALVYGQKTAERAGDWAKGAAVHFYSHVEASNWTVQGLALITGLALLCVELLEIINPFKIAFEPFSYLLGVYNVCFAIIIIVMEGPSEMQCFASCGTWQRLQKKLFGWAAFLGSRTGRAIFYFFVGSMNMFLLPSNWLWALIQICIGGALCFVGVLSLCDRYGCTSICCPTMHQHVGGMNNLADPHSYSQASDSDSEDEESRYESHQHHQHHQHRHHNDGHRHHQDDDSRYGLPQGRQSDEPRRSGGDAQQKQKIKELEQLMGDLPRGGAPPPY